MMIAVVDYGMGNIKSIVSALKYLGVQEIALTNSYDVLERADRLILPGVGSFRQAMENIQALDLDNSLNELVIKSKKPILGICLGMQLMTKSSTEDGFTKGLGFVDAEVTRFEQNNLRIPHVGFNQVRLDHEANIYNGIGGVKDFYFTHSYKVLSQAQINQCTCNYGIDFIASFEMDNIIGVQFHPELSQHNGLQLLDNFIKRF